MGADLHNHRIEASLWFEAKCIAKGNGLCGYISNSGTRQANALKVEISSHEVLR